MKVSEVVLATTWSCMLYYEAQHRQNFQHLPFETDVNWNVASLFNYHYRCHRHERDSEHNGSFAAASARLFKFEIASNVAAPRFDSQKPSEITFRIQKSVIRPTAHF